MSKTVKIEKLDDLMRKFSMLGVKHPFLQKILEQYVQPFENKVDWLANTYEIVVNGQPISNSNIIRSLHFLLRPEDQDYKAPPGAGILAKSLLEIGVPPGLVELPRRKEKTRKNARPTENPKSTSFS